MKPSSSEFVNRHIGPSADDVRQMLTELGLPSLETLIAQSVPDSIRLERDLEIPKGIGEFEALRELRRKFDGVPVAKSMIGQGYYRTKTPPVIARNLFENPAWYTSYTPYQAEISQGRLELLFHFQTLISELAGLPVANSSLLDEATAIAEAAGIAIRHHRSKRDRIVLANELHAQNRDVLASRCELIGVELVDGLESAGSEPDRVAAVVIQTPDTYGQIPETKEWVEWAKTNGALAIFVCDPMALLLTRSPGEAGADICVGSIQRYGVPMGNGGPHAAFIAVAEKFTRMLPGRLVGQSQDTAGEPAYRLALQTREQHIRREKATSNICTAQALLANMAASYAIWHGPEGLKAIASRIHALTARFAASLEKGGWTNCNTLYFDTLCVKTGKATDAVLERATNAGFLFRRIDDAMLAISFDEMSDEEELAALCDIFEIQLAPETDGPLDAEARGAEFLTQPVFHENRSETAMMRYLRQLADKDLALDRAMIPLGSCTMKLNAAAEMAPVSWPEISEIHPFSPPEYLAGYASMIEDLDRWLCEITGFARISFQPNAGSQGEFAGLAAIRRFHDSNGDRDRRVCLIPSSAHGTNPASAQMAGMEVVVVACDDHGNVDLDDLREKAKKHRDRLAALMITYPSTHGVFESAIGEICGIVHEHGGQVYLDGANLNALVGLARPADFGADVCHMNLHKTFCIPHGGGGPGVGPIGVAPHLVDHLPGHFFIGGDHPVSAAPEGSASILPITWMYIRMMGGAGLKRATEIAILNANYLAKKLDPHFPVLYRGEKGWVAHECILDTRQIRAKADIDVEDIAKRLIDYGFHAPTMSWPVAGTLMIEPTESEPKEELDRFAQAMAAIRQEISEVESGKQPADDNCLVNAPHTAQALTQAEWPYAYSRATAIDPSGTGLAGKYWPPVARIDNVYGDRNLVCACPPVNEYAKAG